MQSLYKSMITEGKWVENSFNESSETQNESFENINVSRGVKDLRIIWEGLFYGKGFT